MADRLTKRQRSHVMSRIRGKDTTIEVILRSALHKRGLRFRKNVRGLLGTPDIVFYRAKLLVFVDGDFWHGYRFPQWGLALPDFWQRKIDRNRSRDRRYHARLRRAGWKVIRIWEHDIRQNLDSIVLRITTILDEATRQSLR
ncbi:MAG TPA: very short patch repair endonuclease [Candidatus Angelobacter sp.]|nr:very short patch repair endonuclease [Candidatus Angelobacter sp.]